MRMSNIHQQHPWGCPTLFTTDAARNKARIFELDLIGAFIQSRMRSRIFITWPKIYRKHFPELKEYKRVLLVKGMYGKTLPRKYWF
jgi:hypothetical protein